MITVQPLVPRDRVGESHGFIRYEISLREDRRGTRSGADQRWDDTSGMRGAGRSGVSR